MVVGVWEQSLEGKGQPRAGPRCRPCGPNWGQTRGPGGAGTRLCLRIQPPPSWGEVGGRDLDLTPSDIPVPTY